MSEIKNYRSISLGHREIQFLKMIAEEEMTVYQIYSRFNESRLELKKNQGKNANDGFGYTIVSGHDHDRMAYKNIHKRVKRLETLGLIKKTGQKQERNAIKYRLTSRGLFECLLLSFNGPHPSVLFTKHEDDIILQTMLFQYFELETVKKFIKIFEFGVLFFPRFLEKCCKEIQYRVDGIFSELELEKRPDRSPNIGGIFSPESPNGKFIDKMIRNEAKNLIHEFVRESINLKVTSPIIIKDEKFIELLEEIKSEFLEGSKNFIYRPALSLS